MARDKLEQNTERYNIVQIKINQQKEKSEKELKQVLNVDTKYKKILKLD